MSESCNMAALRLAMPPIMGCTLANSPGFALPRPALTAPATGADRRRLAELESQLRVRYFDSLRGQRLEVLVESGTERPGRVVGTSCRYAPVELSGTAADIGRLISVEAGPVCNGRVQAS